MAGQSALEDRVATLEQEVDSLKQQMAQGERQPPQKSWLDVMAGAFENDPAFAEALRLGREFRASQGTAGQDA